jgi:hypothetical protein
LTGQDARLFSNLQEIPFVYGLLLPAQRLARVSHFGNRAWSLFTRQALSKKVIADLKDCKHEGGWTQMLFTPFEVLPPHNTILKKLGQAFSTATRSQGNRI